MNRIKQLQDQQLAREENNQLAPPMQQIVADEEISTPFFGISGNRGIPTALSLMFKDGCSKAIPYSYITEMDFRPSEGVEISTTSKRLLITGRNLKIIFDYLVQFKVRYLRENIGADTTDENDLFIDGIEVTEY